MTDDEIEALAKKHIAPHADRLDAILPNRVPYQQTEQFRRVKALIVDVLSKLRAPVADERAAFEKCHSAIIKAIASIALTDGPDTKRSSDPELIYRSPVMDDVARIRRALDECSAALASAPVADAAPEYAYSDDGRTVTMTNADRAPSYRASAPVAYERAARDWPEDFSHENGNYQCLCHRCKQVFNGHKRRVTCKVCHAALASAPVAGEAQSVAWENFPAYLIDHCEGDTISEEGLQRALGKMLADPKYAAPQACEAVRDIDLLSEIDDYLMCVVDGSMSRNNAESLAGELRCRIRAALSAQPGAQKYWLCCGSKDPNHSNRRAPDCFNAAKAKWGTADQHSAAQMKGGSDAN
ncbi:hypothetical protein AXY46_03185 [Achromobacter xylosoxidans]|nr:hypothetical protein AXY46_03185 [Achromobacter xylosoxidans]